MTAIVLLATLVPLMGWGQTRTESSLVALTFPDDNSENNKVSSYTDTWTATEGSYNWSISNFNNNSWNNNWTYIKCGRKNNASVATITTSASFSEAISKVELTIDAITASKVNSIKLYTGTTNSSWTEAGSFTAETGVQTVTLSNPTANLYYKVEFDCAAGSSNGLVTVSKVEYYHNGNGTTSPTITVDPTALSGFDYVYNEGPSTVKTFTISGSNLTATTYIYTSENYEISSFPGESFYPESTITINTNTGVYNYTIKVRLKAGLAIGTYNEFLTISQSEVEDFTFALSGSVTSNQVVATPTFSPEGGTYNEAQTVTISCTTQDATIRYTLDDTEPNENSAVYTSPLTINETTTVKAKAWKSGLQASEVATATYTIVYEPELTATPASLSGFNYIYSLGPSTTQNFYLSGEHLTDTIAIVAPEGFEICLTANGAFTNDIEFVSTSGTLDSTTVYVRMAAGLNVGSYSGQVMASAGNASAAVVLSGTVADMPLAATPTFSLEGGTYLITQSVVISSTTENAVIHYTLDGTDPTINSPIYSNPIEVSTTTTIKAMATAEHYNNSTIASVTYTIYEPVSISDIRNLPNNTYACMEGTVVFIDGRNVYVQDQTAGLDLYLNNNTVPNDLALGDNVRAYGKKTVYNGLVELSGINGGNDNEFSILSSGNTLPLAIKTIAEINDDFSGNNMLQSTRVKIQNAIIGSINPNGTTIISQGDDQLNVYHIPTVEGMIEGDWVTLIGVIGCYNAPQLRVASADDIQFSHRPTLTASPNSLSGFEYSYASGGPSEIQHFLLSGSHLIDNVSVYPSEHFEVSTFGGDLFTPENPSIVYTTMGGFYGISIYVRMKADLEVGTYTDLLTIVSDDADTIYVTVTGSVTGDGPTPPPVSGDYIRINSLSQLTNGSRVILTARYDEVQNEYVALFNTLTSGKFNTTEFSSHFENGNEIIPESLVATEDDYYWTVGVTANGYTFTNANGDVVGYNSSTNFNMNGDKTEWTVSAGTSDPASMVPDYYGFTIVNVATDSRAFAINTNHVCGAYSVSNMTGNNAPNYNYYLDLFVKGEGGSTPVVATPTFSPEGGSYFEAQTVSIACTTEGATIHYTLDGSDPTESSPIYSSPLTIETTTTVKAFAVKEDYQPSAIATATYVIQTGYVTIFNQDWEGEMNGWTFVDVEGEASWNIAQYGGNHYAYANGYNHGANIDWCISPAFNLDDIDNPVLTFLTAKNYNGPDLEVYFSNNYNGTNPTTATWTALTCNLSSGSWTWTESGDIDLSGFSGTSCYIGFKYTSEESQAAGWEVDDIMLIGQTTTPVITATPLSLTGFSYIVGNGPSSEQSFTVSGMNLTANLTLAEAADFEISTTSGSAFNAQNTITLEPTNGTVDETTIYVRMKAGLSIGAYDSENIEIVSAGASTVVVTCSGSVVEEPVPGGDYVRISNVSDLQDGNKVILAARYNETINAYLATVNTLTSGKLTTTAFTSQMSGANEIIPSEILANEDDYYWTVNVTAEGYTFTNADGDMIGYGSSGTNFVMGGEKTEWTVSTDVSGESALVPNYFGFNIINVATSTRGFALRVTETESVVKAYATSNMNSSEYNFFLDIFMQGEGGTCTVAAPTFEPEGGTYYEPLEVTLNCTTPDATIWYSPISGNGPWTPYTEAITVEEYASIWAYASKEGCNDSPVVNATYVIQDDIVIIFNQDWEEDWHGWTEVNVTGDSLWRIASYNGNHYAYANGYNHDASIDWLISPAFDLDLYSDVVLTFKTAKNYTGPELEVYFSNDYDGQNPATATWQPLSCALSQGSWNWVESGEISLGDFSGSNCYIGFKYTCTDEEAAGWEVDDIMLYSGNISTDPYLHVTPNTLSGFTHIIDQGPSEVQTFTLSGGNFLPLPGGGYGSVILTMGNFNDSGFEMSLDGEDFTSSYLYIDLDETLTLEPTTVYVRLWGEQIGQYDASIYIEEPSGTSVTVALSGVVLSEDEPLIEAYMPLYIQGNNGSNNNRVPVATAVIFMNLEPSTTYRYTNQFIDGNDGPETAGAGNVIYASQGGFYRSTSPSLSTEGGYGEFTTDEDGIGFAWCINEPTANARFTPGNHVYLRIRVNDGHDGTTVSHIFTTEDYATVLNFGTESEAYQGTAFYAKSNEAPMTFAMLFSSDIEERPVYSTPIETTGIDYGSISQYASFYKEEVAGKDGWFGGILPNDNDNGINEIWILDLESYIVNYYHTENGQWYPEANTVNPTNGLDEPIFIDLTYDGVTEAPETHLSVWTAFDEFIIENGDDSHYAMTVYNLLGQPVIKEQINANSTVHLGHHLSKGLYIFSFLNNKTQVSIKVMVR